MAHSEMHRLTELLERNFDGPAWHGPSIREVLDEVHPENAGIRCNDSHSLVEIVLHMTIWRQYVIRLMKGDHSLASEQETTFPRVAVLDEYSWSNALVSLDQSHEILFQAWKHFPEEDLDKTVPGGRDYTWYTLFHGLLQHDAYHLGQLQLMLRHLKH
jgi:uncharacterized damage-inducible protein DinB